MLNGERNQAPLGPSLATGLAACFYFVLCRSSVRFLLCLILLFVLFALVDGSVVCLLVVCLLLQTRMPVHPTALAMTFADTRTPSHVSGSLLASRVRCVFVSIVVILFLTALLFVLHFWAGKGHIKEYIWFYSKI